ncbi:hypothetical protein EDC01DRAFT_753585 [Geopyxis carbonaria]|nr:hypothetical protein EDC01DRAFT_753585 [Geopyxis carbonaria]
MPQTLTFQKESGPSSLALRFFSLPETLSDVKVLIRLLASPINPVDGLVLADRYPVKPRNSVPSDEPGRFIAGYDGVAEVLKLTPSVTTLNLGDHVLFKNHDFGTWRTHAIAQATELTKLLTGLQPTAAALSDLAANLKPGDGIIITAAVGVITQFTIQLAARRGLRVVAVVRDRLEADADAISARLKALGAEFVVPESALHTASWVPPPALQLVLALDAVFRPVGSAITSLLAPGATYVVYGMLGGQKMEVSPELFIFKQAVMRNFRLTNSLNARSEEERSAVVAEVAGMLVSGELKAPEVEEVEWIVDEDGKGYVEAVTTAGPVGTRKRVFVFKH